MNIPNLYKVGDDLYSSGQPPREDFAALAEQGLKHIVNLRPPFEMEFDEEALVASLGMTYHNIPVDGAGINFENAALLANKLQDIGDQPTLVHCASGNRNGSLAALIAAQEQEMDAESAIAEGRRWGLTRYEPLVRQLLGSD
ncbi:MAG: protein tyrosine phosphatase family protein [Gammaproteobacteria bacterium]|nr:protein tyrosine phosphatase family protein [Gammaproteobacteria bacterium]